MITIDQLSKIYNTTSHGVLVPYLDPLNNTCDEFSIDNTDRQSMFLANVGVESRNLQVVIENLNYSADGLLATFPKYFTRASANAAARNPQKIANIVYANRMGNGSTASGEGWLYRGRRSHSAYRKIKLSGFCHL